MTIPGHPPAEERALPRTVAMFRQPRQRVISAYRNGKHCDGFQEIDKDPNWKHLTVAEYARHAGAPRRLFHKMHGGRPSAVEFGITHSTRGDLAKKAGLHEAPKPATSVSGRRGPDETRSSPSPASPPPSVDRKLRKDRDVRAFLGEFYARRVGRLAGAGRRDGAGAALAAVGGEPRLGEYFNTGLLGLAALAGSSLQLRAMTVGHGCGYSSRAFNAAVMAYFGHDGDELSDRCRTYEDEVRTKLDAVLAPGDVLAVATATYKFFGKKSRDGFAYDDRLRDLNRRVSVLRGAAFAAAQRVLPESVLIAARGFAARRDRGFSG
ncbi:hypothetical protein JL720_16704 [Aureococcus anophagefferens]|nr:hypothetical protein JL720_16704 [Aureococcus anophagefferens]